MAHYILEKVAIAKCRQIEFTCCLIAFFLMPKWRSLLEDICVFICSSWTDAWFSDHYYDESISINLKQAIETLNFFRIFFLV